MTTSKGLVTPESITNLGIRIEVKKGEPKIVLQSKPAPTASLDPTATKDKVYPTEDVSNAIRGIAYLPSDDIIKKTDDKTVERLNLLYPRFFQYRTTLQERLWLNACMKCVHKTIADPALMMILIVTFKFGYDVYSSDGQDMPKIKGPYTRNWDGLKKFVRANGKPPTRRELEYDPSAAHFFNSNAKTAVGRARAQALAKDPANIIELFQRTTVKDKDTGCTIWTGKINVINGRLGVVHNQIFGPGKLMQPYAQTKARRFAYMYMRPNHTPDDLPPHAHLQNKPTCHIDCVTPEHLSTYA